MGQSWRSGRRELDEVARKQDSDEMNEWEMHIRQQHEMK